MLHHLRLDTIPYDNGLDGLVSKKKDFIGKRSLQRSAFTAEDRQRIVGVVPLDKQTLSLIHI